MSNQKEELRKAADTLFRLNERATSLSIQLEEVTIALEDLRRELLLISEMKN